MINKTKEDLLNELSSITQIEIDSDIKSKMATSIDNMINWFIILDKLDTEGIEPIFNPLELFQSTLINLREDKIAEGNMQDLILKNTQHKEDVFITVPKVIE